MTLKKLLVIIFGLLVLALIYLALFPAGQRPDRSFDASVPAPAYVNKNPVILFDRGHNNAQSPSGGYAPFVKLMKNDGYTVRTHRGEFTRDALSIADILVIVNADGGTNPKLFGFNLVPLRKGVRGSPAFSEHEVETVRQWVEEGGSLLLVADHAPFGTASAGLASAFGVTMHAGFTEIRNQYPDQMDPSIIQFSSENGLLSEHPIILGRSENEHIHQARSFTGQSLDGPPQSTLLKLPPSAVEMMPVTSAEAARQTSNPPAGSAQAVAFEYGRGRVVVLGEAAMITAQIDQNGNRFGMNIPGTDNRQFVLNLMHWLSHLF